MKCLVMICTIGLAPGAPLVGQDSQVNALVQTLNRLKGQTAFRGSLSLAYWSRTTKDGEQEDSQHQTQSTVTVVVGPGGLSFNLPPQLFNDAFQEQAVQKPRARTPPALASLSYLRLEEIMPLLNFAPRLRFLISQGVLKSVGQENYRNRPHRYYEYEMPVPLSDSESKKIKKLTHAYRVWVNDSEIPVGMRYAYSKSIKVFLGFGLDEDLTENYAFEVQGDRLVVRELESLNTTKNVVVSQTRKVFELH